MSTKQTCPSSADLEKLMVGQLPDPAVEQLAAHLEQCRHCADTIRGLKLTDTLAEAARQSPMADGDPSEAAVEQLIQRLKGMRPADPQETTTAAASGQPVSASVSDATLAGLAPPQSAEEVGRLGGYRVLKILGAGGMGMVYHGEDVHLQRPIALKVMKPEVSKNPTARERFLREARAAAKLKSDHVVTIHQVGEERQVVFLAMEFLEGMSLDDWLKKGRKPTQAQAARIGRQIALGLADAHACGLIHRDIKPGNIWLDSRHQGRVKLLDFGLARGDNEEHQLTQSGAIVGTPAYMAPEQARGEHVDHRGDLFSLGVVLYRLTTGQMPFRGDNTMAVLTSLAMDTPKPPREIDADISPRMAALIERLLSKDREQRPATATAVAGELAAIEREATQPATDERTIEGAAHAAQRSKRFSSAYSAALRARLVGSARFRWLVAASLLLSLGVMAAAIVVIIRDKQGNKIAEIEVPEGGGVHIKDQANQPLKESLRIEPEPLAPMAAGEPLSPYALVRQPAKLPGVRSWSIAPREPFAPTAAVAYRPDGKQLAVGSWLGTVHIWEAITGRLLRVFHSQAAVFSLAWSPDGRVLAVGTNTTRRHVHLWQAETGRLLRTLETPKPDSIVTLSWSPDGRQLRAWGQARQCYTWEVAKGKLLHAPRIACQCDRPVFSPDGRRLAGTGDGNRILIWDADTGQEVSRLLSPAAVGRLRWSPNGQRLAVTGEDGLRVWNMETRKETLHSPTAVHQGYAIIWSPDGRSLAFVLPHGQTMLLDAASGEELRRLAGSVHSWMAWSPDGRMIARANGYGWVTLADSFTGERRLTLAEGAMLQDVAASPDLQTVAVADQAGTLLISTDTGQTRGELKQTIGPLAFSPDGKRLAAQGLDHTVQVWRAGGKLDLTLGKHKAEVTSLAWSPDGKNLASTAAGVKRVVIWEAVKGQRDRDLGPFSAAAESVKWSADGRLLTFNVPKVGWHVWDVHQKKLVNDPKQWKLFWFDLTPDGRSALVAPTEKDVYRLRDLANGKEGLRLPFGPSTYLAHPSWPADGAVLTAASHYGVELWRADLSKWLRNLQQPNGANQVFVSRDGKLLAARSDVRLFVWEIDTGRLRGILVLGRRNNALTITPKGRYTGNDNVDSGIVMVVEKDDGTQEMLEPAEFKQRYGFKNDPNKVHLLLPPKESVPIEPEPLPPLTPSEPLGLNALVRRPAKLPGVRSWSIAPRQPAVVSTLAYRPDGKRIAVGSWECYVHIWEVETGRLVQVLVADTTASSLAWSPDGRVLAVGTGVNKFAVSLWDVASGRRLRKLESPVGDFIWALAWSLDGRKVRAWGDAGRLCTWEVTHGKLLHDRPIACKSPMFSADGQRFAGIVDGKRILVWDADTGEEVSRLDAPSALWRLAWAPHGKSLASTGEDGLRVWDVASRKETFRYDKPVGIVNPLSWSPDGRSLSFATEAANSSVAVIDVVPDSQPHRLGDILGCHSYWSPDGKTIACLSGGPFVRLFDPVSGKQLRSLIEGATIAGFAWRPDGRTLAVADSYRTVVISADTGQSVAEFKDALWPLAWSPDGKLLAAAGPSNAVLLRPLDGKEGRTLAGHEARVESLAWSPDGKWLASTAAGEKLLRIWDMVKEKQDRELGPFGGAAEKVKWSADGRRLTFNVAGVGWHVWDVEKNRLLNDPKQWKVLWFDLAPDGRSALVGPTETDVYRLRDLASGKEGARLPHAHFTFLAYPAWTTDGKLLALTSYGAIELWHSDLRARVRSLQDTNGAANQVAFSGDGKFVAALQGAWLWLWETDTGRLHGIMQLGKRNNGLTLTPDGQYTGNAAVDNSIVIVVRKDDGTQEMLEPAEFKRKYGFQHDPDKVHLLQALPPSK